MATMNWADGRVVTFEATEAKGRNGYFKAQRAEIWPDPYGEGIWLDVWSKRIGGAPPLRLELSQVDARALGRALLGDDAEEIRGLLGAFATVASQHQSCLMCGSEEERDEAAVGAAKYEGHEPRCLVLEAWAALGYTEQTPEPYLQA